MRGAGGRKGKKNGIIVFLKNQKFLKIILKKEFKINNGFQHKRATQRVY